MNPVGNSRKIIGSIVTLTIFCTALFAGVSQNVRAEPYAAFEPPHSDSGLDTDSNGLYDYLVVDVVLNLSSPGYYTIDAVLYDSVWSHIDDYNHEALLDAGIQTVEVRFDGIFINTCGMDGPYYVQLFLYDLGLSLLDEDFHVTAAYGASEFEKPFGFEPPHSDYGLDTDDDGRFDLLVVDVAVFVAMAGDFQLQGYLRDGSWNRLGYGYNGTFLEEGNQTVELRFYGVLISNLGVDGPYTVDLWLSQFLFNSIDSDVYLTAAYNSTDFQSGTHFEPPHADHGLDTDNDGFFNRLAVEVVINVTSAGSHMIDAYLYDAYLVWLGTDTLDVFLDSGIQTVEFSFSGMPVNYNEQNGPYQVELNLYDTIDLADTNTYLTSAYNWTDFQPPPKFEPPHSDFGLDTDGDELFNNLVVEAIMNATVPGYYTIHAELADSDIHGLGGIDNYTYLDIGIQTVELLFDGVNINVNGEDGPYYVELTLYEADFFSIGQDFFWTSPYNWTEFDPPPGFEPPHSDYGFDTDSDGLYNYLVIEALVDLSSPGYYSVYARLYDNDDLDYITYDYNETYLDVGVQAVEARFSGMKIYNCGFDGPYFVELELYDEYDLLDSDTHVTAAYNWTYFQTGTVFEPYHSDSGLDVDDDGLFDYVVVEVVVNVSLAGEYEIFSHLRDLHDNHIDTDYNYTFRSVGVQTLEFRFDGPLISENGVDGPYKADLYLLEGVSGVQLDTDTYYTASYSLIEFPDMTAPVADAGEDCSADEDTIVSFDGTGSTDNIGIADYAWSFVDVTPKQLFGANPEYNFTQPGIYLITLNVTDVAGNWDTDTVNATIADTTPPVADAGPNVYSDINTPIVLDGSRSTDNVGIINYTWTFADGVLQTLHGARPSYTFATLGQYNVTLSVQDAAGHSDTDNLTVTAIVDTERPTADAGADRIVNEDTVVTLDGSGSIDNVGIVSYRWTFNDSGYRTLSGVEPTYTFATPGTYSVTLVVTDVVNLSASDSVVITVRDTTPPTADAGPEVTVRRGDIVTLDGSGSSDNVAVVNYTWTLDIGGETAVLYGVSPSYEFSDIGVYEVTLTARDAGNNTGTDAVIVIVEGGARASFIEDYWWAILALTSSVAALVVVYLLMKKGRGKEEQLVPIEHQPSMSQEEETPPGPRS